MKLIYIDCFHGAAGDMLLAALIDAGLDPAALTTTLGGLGLSGYRIEHERTVSHHVSGVRLRVQPEAAQPERSWAQIRALLESSTLPERARVWALACFARLAHAEAHIHGCTPDEVHFHEVGALDSIVDMVGCCVGLDMLGIERIYASALPLGSGWVQTRHGMLPVPAPATLALLAEAGAPVIPAPSPGELLTPTAAALLAELATFAQPPMYIHTVGYGLGHKEFARLNGCRVWIGETLDRGQGAGSRGQGAGSDKYDNNKPHHDHHHDPQQHNHHPPQPLALEELVELRCNLDDVTGEVVAFAIERLLAAGALDAWAAPLVMKKGRPALQLGCLAHPAAVEALANIILRETPTLGVRWQALQRRAAGRAFITAETPWGSVRLKQKILDGQVLSSAPEYEDCAALARAHNVPLTQIYAAALSCATE